MNNNQRVTVRAMLLVSIGLVLFADVMGVIEEGVMVLLSFIGIFAMLYGLSMMGALDQFFVMIGKVYTYIKNFFHRVFSFRGKKKNRKSVSKEGDMPTIKLTGHRKKRTETRVAKTARVAKKKVASKSKRAQALKTEKTPVKKVAPKKTVKKTVSKKVVKKKAASK